MGREEAGQERDSQDDGESLRPRGEESVERKKGRLRSKALDGKTCSSLRAFAPAGSLAWCALPWLFEL